MGEHSRQASATGGLPALAFLEGGGELGERMRAFDWSKSPLGAPEAWPQSLKTCVRIILTSRQPMFVWWGDELINLYNDAYKAIVGGKHPEALGQPASVVWREIWDQVGPRAASAMEKNEGTYDEALLLIMERNGYPEETYYTFSYSPVPSDQGGTGGLICANTDDTQRIIGARQLGLLRELAACAVSARTPEQACALLAQALATDAKDLPFALIYLLDAQQNQLSLAASAGVEPGHPIAPERVAEGDRWVFAPALGAREPLVVPVASGAGLPSGGWPRPPSRVAALPIASSGPSGRAGLLLVGLSPFRLYDDDYRGFLRLVSGQIAAGIASAQAYEEERRRAEALAELDRAKTTFFSNISHEFRTPLTLMLGPIEDALRSPGRSLSGAELETTRRNALRLLKLVNALLDFSRIEAGRMQARYEPVDLSALTAELASAFRSAIERAGLTFEVDAPTLAEPIYVDRDLWEKIVLNLLSNALKFTFQGAIGVRVRWGGDHAELEVSDTGVGIPAAEMPHLFERFHRVHGSRSRTHEGSGIGLALVNELVKMHGGSIRAASRPGEGTTFTVSVPRGSAHVPPEQRRERAAPSFAAGAAPFVQEALRWLPDGVSEPPLGPPPAVSDFADDRGAHVLLADDNADMREYVARLLRERWSVEAVADGAAALEAASRRVPDLVLSDVMMPNLDGFGLLAELRARPATRHVPVLLLSARAGEESRVEGLSAGADDYLVKPFSARELIARVATHLQLARLRKTAERERAIAEAASRAKDEFLSTLSHELRTPLNAIVGWASLLRAGSVPPDKLGKALLTIERNAHAQARLIDDLLDVSRIEQGKLVLNVAPVEVERVVEAAIDSVRPAADAKDIRLQPALDSRAVIAGDADRLQQVVWNLLSNAIKFTPKGGRVQVRLRREPSRVELVVADTGEGIAADFLPHVFERFRQADASFTRRAGGLGLGLAIVRHLVEMHGGTVKAHSDGPGQGAVFTVRLPVAPLRADRPSRPIPDEVPLTDGSDQIDYPPVLRGLRVLVVDDEPDARELLRFVLARCGCRVTTAAGPAEALSALGAQAVDLLISDIGTATGDGCSLIREVRKLDPPAGRIPALALTAYARSEDRMQALKAGFQMHLAKPIDPQELLIVMATLLGGYPRP